MLVRATHCKTFYLINKPVCRIQLFKMSIMLWCNTFCHLKPFCTDLLLRLIFYVAKVQLGRSQLISGWSGGWMVQVVVPLKWCFSRLCLSPHLTIPCTECKSIIPHHCVFSILIWYIVKVVILMGVHICMTTLCNKVTIVTY